MIFKSIYNHIPRGAVISEFSEVKRDESLTISQIISLHLRGINPDIHVYDEVKYENGLSDYRDEILNEEAYDMERDLSDYNCFVPSSNDNHVQEVRNDAPTSSVKARGSVSGEEPLTNENSSTSERVDSSAS